MNHFGLKKASSWTQVSSVPAKRPFHLSSLVGPPLYAIADDAEAAEGNARAARVERRYTIQRTIRWLKNRCQVGPQFSSSAPPRSPAPPFDHFPFGPRLGHIVTTNRPCDSRDSISPSFDTYTNVLNDLTAIFRPIAVFMRVLCGFSRRALHSVELSRTRVAKAIRLSEVQEIMFPRRESEARAIAETSLRRSIAHIPCKAPGRSFEDAGQIPT